MLRNTFITIVALCVSVFGASVSQGAPGDHLWTGTIGGDPFTWSTPVLTDSLVIIQGQGGGITGLNKSDGSQAWYTAGTEATTASPVLYNGKLYLAAGQTLYRIDPDTGTIENSRATGEMLYGLAPTVVNERLYFHTYNTDLGAYTLRCASTSTLADLWTKPLNSSASTMTDGQALYVLTDTLRAYDLDTGDLLWSVAPVGGHTGFDTGAIAGGWLFAISDSNSDTSPAINAYTLNDDRTNAPRRRWTKEISDSYWADSVPPVVDNNLVYVNSREGVLQARSIASGAVQWSRTVRSSGSATALPVVANGRVFIETESGGTQYMTSYNAATGEVLWQTAHADMDIAWGQPTLDTTGVYLACDSANGILKFERSAADETWSMIKNNAQQTSGQFDLDPPMPPDNVVAGPNLLLLN